MSQPFSQKAVKMEGQIEPLFYGFQWKYTRNNRKDCIAILQQSCSNPAVCFAITQHTDIFFEEDICVRTWIFFEEDPCAACMSPKETCML